jgi:putative transposase
MPDDGGMSRSLKSYDHRLRELVRRTGDPSLATRIGVPRSTAAGWLSGTTRSTVSADALSMTEGELQAEVLRLRGQVERLRAIARILFACFRALDIDVSRTRVPDGGLKSALIHAVERGRDVLRLRRALPMIGLSPSRFHTWKRAERGCDLDDHSSCPKSSPQRVTSSEVAMIRDLVTSSDTSCPFIGPPV